MGAADAGLQPQPPDRPEGKNAASDPRLETAVSMLGTQPPELLVGESTVREPRSEATIQGGKMTELEAALQHSASELQTQPRER
jgi:hypothetical protein